MTDDRMRTLDPRFDPAFQRHGSGVTGAPARRGWGDATAAPAERIDGEAGIDALLGGLPEAGDPVAPSGGDAVIDHVDLELADPRRALRWEIAILVTGVVLVVVGVAGMVWGMDLYYGTMSTAEPSDFTQLRSRQVALSIGPPVVGVGVAALVGLLFLRAIASRSRG